MLIHLGYDIIFEVPVAVPFLALLGAPDLGFDYDGT